MMTLTTRLNAAVVCGAKTFADTTCSQKCSFQLQKLNQLDKAIKILERIENLLINRLTVAEPQKEVGTNGK